MVYEPETEDSLYLSMRDRLQGKIVALTNFVPTSFNYVWTRAFAERVRENEVALLAAELSGYIDYAGGPVTQDQLDALGLQNVTAAEVNEYMFDEDLDELVAILGVSRDEGDLATGSVTITTVSSSTTIPAGTQFGTEPDSQGNYLGFETVEDVTAESGVTEVTVDVTAEAVGSEYNIGSGEITYLVNPPSGVNAVTNNNATSGGVDEENNDELRERSKQSVLNQSGGGTVLGIEGYVEDNAEGVRSVFVDEFKNGGPRQTSPYAEVVVDGGIDSVVEDAIDMSRPSAIRHYLVRPTIYDVRVEATVEGDGVDTEDAESVVIDYLGELNIGEDVYRDKIVQSIMNADSSIDNIDTLDIYITDEEETFSSGTDVYSLDKVPESDGITEVTGTFNGSSDHTFTEGSDYQELDNDSDTFVDAIDWSLGGDDPDDGTSFFIDYIINNDIAIGTREKAEPETITITTV